MNNKVFTIYYIYVDSCSWLCPRVQYVRRAVFG